MPTCCSAAPSLPPPTWATLVVIRDVTQQRQLESVRRDFVANVSHELKTPLADIVAVETLQRQRLEDPDNRGKFLDRIGKQAQRLPR